MQFCDEMSVLVCIFLCTPPKVNSTAVSLQCIVGTGYIIAGWFFWTDLMSRPNRSECVAVVVETTRITRRGGSSLHRPPKKKRSLLLSLKDARSAGFGVRSPDWWLRPSVCGFFPYPSSHGFMCSTWAKSRRTKGVLRDDKLCMCRTNEDPRTIWRPIRDAKPRWRSTGRLSRAVRCAAEVLCRVFINFMVSQLLENPWKSSNLVK